MFKISDWFKLILCTVLSSGVATAGNFGQMNFAYWQTIVTGPTATYLVVAGGGGGGVGAAAGGGAGGLLTGTTSLTLGITYTVTVGTGGTGASGSGSNGTNGSNSIISGSGFTTITSIGGGKGADSGTTNAGSGGSGGGASWGGGAAGTGTSGQGYAGGIGTAGSPYNSGGGGGAGAVGTNATSSTAGVGGVGVASSITGSSVYYAGGGGGAGSSQSGSAGGAGGNGGGGSGASGGSSGSGGLGTANTGGGGGGGTNGSGGPGGNGGSGVVIISLPTGFVATTTGTPTITYDGTNTVYTFTGSGTITPVAWSYAISSAGLVAYLSAGISASYSGSGSTWTDLSPYSNNFTLYGSPTYSSGSGGYLSFSGSTSQYGKISSFSGLGTSPSYTMCVWTYLSSVAFANGSDNPVIWYGSSGGNAVASFDFKGTGSSSNYCDLHYGDDKTFTSYTPSSGAWYYGIITYDGTTKNTTLYVNNVNQQTLTHSGSLNISSSAMAIAGDNSSIRTWLGQIGEIHIYNRVLTTTEISQNWTATKTRYGY